MFPNVRLLIGALFASVIALSCGFGVFAAFRINHDPLSRLPADTALLQLVNEETVQPTPGVRGAWEASSGPPLDRAQTDSAVMDASATVPVQRAAIEIAHRVIPQAVNAAASTATPRPPAPPPPKSSAASAPDAAATAGTPPSTALQPVAALTSAPAAPRLPGAEAQPLGAAAVAQADAAAKTAAPAKAALPAVADIEPATKAASPPAPPAEVTGALPQPAAAEAPPGSVKPPRKIARRRAELRRLVRRRAVRKANAAAARSKDQDSYFADPIFRSAPDFQQQSTAQAWTAGKPVRDNAAAGYTVAWPNDH